MILGNFKKYSLFASEDTVPYGASAKSSTVNHAPLLIKKELNSLYNYIKVKFNENPLDWYENESYTINDIVYHSGSLYGAIADSVGITPPNIEYWREIQLNETSLDSTYVSLDSTQYIGSEIKSGKQSMIVGADRINAIRTPKNGLLPNDATSDLGQSSDKFNNIHANTVHADDFLGTSSSAKYADIAERYRSDTVIESGTVVAVGGTAEITIYQPGMKVAGVISTAPAYKMNDDPNEDHTLMPFVALKGKIPVKVSTNVTKGDYMLASDEVPGEAYGVITMDKEITISGITFTIKDPDMERRFLGIALEDYTVNINYNTVNIKV